MIKGRGKTAFGTDVLFLGLSGENVTRLAAGEPIAVKAEELQALGLPAMTVIVSYGRTEADIMTELKSHGMVLRDVLE